MTTARVGARVGARGGAQMGARVGGWLLAGAIAAGLVGGAAAFALSAERRASVLVLDLAAEPPAAPAIAAVAEAAPDVALAEPVLPEPDLPEPDLPDTAEATDPAAILPEETLRPTLAAAAVPLPPELDTPVASDLSLPKPEPKPEAKPEPKRKPEPKPEPKPEAEATREKKRDEPRTEKAAPTKEPAAEKPAAAKGAPSSGAKAKGGGLSPAAYAKAVLKKVRATKRKSGAGKGTVVVGFTIAADGGLASVQVLQSSGNAALDEVALGHIRRSAPFPAPPAGAQPGYSFEFVGK